MDGPPYRGQPDRQKVHLKGQYLLVERRPLLQQHSTCGLAYSTSLHSTLVRVYKYTFVDLICWLVPSIVVLHPCLVKRGYPVRLTVKYIR